MVYVSSTPLTSAGSIQLTVKTVSFTLRTFRLPTGPDSEGTDITKRYKCTPWDFMHVLYKLTGLSCSELHTGCSLSLTNWSTGWYLHWYSLIWPQGRYGELFGCSIDVRSGSIEVVHIEGVGDDSIRFSWWAPGEGEGGCRGSSHQHCRWISWNYN